MGRCACHTRGSYFFNTITPTARSTLPFIFGYIVLSLDPHNSHWYISPFFPFATTLLCFINMATWFSVVARIASTEGIADSIYQNALCEFPEGTRNTEPESEDSWRAVFISFYGDLLQAGKNYIIFGSARLPANTDTDMPLVSNALLKLRALTFFCNLGSLTVIYSSLPTTPSLT